MKTVIELDRVSKQFYFYRFGRLSLKHFLVDWFGRRGPTASEYKSYFSLQDISMRVQAGECLGIIGQNGAGKSTLLKVISGVYQPTKGSVRIEGTMSFLAEITAGFQQELTGLENMYLMGMLYGYSKRQIRSNISDILDFAELEEFINVPLKYYSSGMSARLGFAMALSTQPDIMMIDEVLAVGDERFRSRCLEKIRQVRDSGTTILFVSHNMNYIQAICDRVIWLQGGSVHEEGKADGIVPRYLEDQRSTKRRIYEDLNEQFRRD